MPWPAARAEAARRRLRGERLRDADLEGQRRFQRDLAGHEAKQRLPERE